jgi:ABC-type multidrug transport system fused ATPase/permease subunit
VASVFYSLSLLALPRLWMVQFFVLAVQSMTELRVSLQRIDAFLSTPEPPLPVHTALTAAEHSSNEQGPPAGSPLPHKGTASAEKGAVAAKQEVGAAGLHLAPGTVMFRGADFDWAHPMGGVPAPPTARAVPAAENGEGPAVSLGPTLAGLTFTLRPGELLGICGEVGSGESQQCLDTGMIENYLLHSGSSLQTTSVGSPGMTGHCYCLQASHPCCRPSWVSSSP